MARGKLYLVLLTLIATISLHYMSNMSSHNGLGGNMFSLSGNNVVNSEKIEELMKSRSKLNQEIALLQHVVQQLKQVLISSPPIVYNIPNIAFFNAFFLGDRLIFRI